MFSIFFSENSIFPSTFWVICARSCKHSALGYLYLYRCNGQVVLKTYELGDVYAIRRGSWNVTACERKVDFRKVGGLHVCHIVLCIIGVTIKLNKDIRFLKIYYLSFRYIKFINLLHFYGICMHTCEK